MPYRVAAPFLPEPKKPPRAELVYVSGDREKHVAPARAAIQIGIVGSIVGIVVAAAGYVEPSMLILVITVGIAVWRWRGAADVAGIVLRVDGGMLDVRKKKAGHSPAILRVRLEHLANVSLDTKSIQKVVEGSSLIPAVRFLDSKVGPELDIARIVLEVDGLTETVKLSEAYVAHMDSIEWLGKIRTFLRSHGWVPEDERAEEADAEASEGE